MANNTSTHFFTVPREILISSVVFKFTAMIIGVLGNVTIIVHTIFTSKEKTATSYLVGNLALADLLVCLTFYPIWIVEFMQTILNIDSDQDLFCKLSRSTIFALQFASVAALFAITLDKFFYIVKPLKYPLIVTKRRVFVAMLSVWFTACSVFAVLLDQFEKYDGRLRSFCHLDYALSLFMDIFTVYVPLALIIVLNVWILIVAEKQRKRILAETTTNTSGVNKFFRALKAVKTFCIVVALLAFCVIIPTVVRRLLYECPCSVSYLRLWIVVFHYEFYGINSVVNAFIYGTRHTKYRKAPGHIFLLILQCNEPLKFSGSEFWSRTRRNHPVE